MTQEPQSRVIELSQVSHQEYKEQHFQALLRLVLDSMPQVSFWKDRNSVYLGCNQQFAQIAGLNHPNEIIGKTDYDLPWTKEQSDWYREYDRRVMETDTAEKHIIEPIQQADGKQAWLDTSKIPLHDPDGNVIGILGTFEDITERKLAEIALEQAKAASEQIIEERTAELRQLVEQLQTEIRERQKVEEALKQQQQEYQIIFNAAPAMIWYKDADNRILRVNQAAAASMGMSVAELEGQSMYDLYPAEAAAYHADDLEVIQSGTPKLGLVESYQTALGEKWWIETSKIPYRDDAGNALGVIVFAVNVTDRKNAEAAHRESEQMHQQILDAITDLVLCKGPESKLLYANKAFRDYYGMTVEQLQGIIDAPFNDPDYTQQYVIDDAYVFSTGKMLEIPAEPVTRYDGEVRLFHTVKAAIFNSEGKVVQTVGVSRDITERQLAEEALRRSDAQSRQQAQELEQALHELRTTQTQLVQTEKMSSLGQLVAGVAHEINNPVNFIYGNLTYTSNYTQDLLNLVKLYQQHYPNPVPAIQSEIEAIDLEFLLEDLPKILASMKVGAERIQKIVLSLRHFSRMDEAEMKPVDIHEGIDSTLMILQNRLKPKPEHPAVQVVKEYSDLPLIECYAGQLNQVFMNILSNAIDALEESFIPNSESGVGHTDPGKMPAIRIRTELLNQDRILIRIADNGPGIPETVQQRLFDPFFTTKPVGKGTGLGLSISYQVVTEKHSGQLKCNSVLGEGTEFLIEIPTQQTGG